VSYFMESPRESGRLAAKVDAGAWVSTYLADRFGGDDLPDLPPGGAVLDIGCGPGVLLAELSRRRPDLLCVGVDASVARTVLAQRRPRLAFTRGEAERLPFRSSAFCLVVVRFLLEYLPSPAAALREVRRVCADRASVLLQDLDGQLVSSYPPDPEVDRTLGVVLDALAGTGFDPWVGRKLYSLALDAGLRPVAVDLEAYHLVAGPVDPASRAEWALKLDVARRGIEPMVGAEAAAAAVAAFLAYLERDDSLTFSTLFTVHATT
jgi:SAM-dependent methyltransferase